MQSVNWRVANLTSGSPQKITKTLDTQKIELDIKIIFKCVHCKREFTNSSSNCCGYNNNHRSLECDITTTFSNTLSSDLINDLRKLLFNKELSDFSIQVGNEEIPVHKNILSARSPVFEKMFNSDFKEKIMTHHKLQLGISKEAFKELIRFIYTEEIQNFDNYVIELLLASDYYEMSKLKKLCEDKMFTILTDKNANTIFQSAHLYRCRDELKKAAFVKIKEIFKMRNYNLSENLSDDPTTVEALIIAKEHLEKLMENSGKTTNVVGHKKSQQDILSFNRRR